MKTTGDGKFFIIGLRRSGTSILRTLVSKLPGVSKILFEPHELFHAAQLLKIPRYKNSECHIEIINSFNNLPKWSGAKIALNPGVDALEWVWLYKMFPQARFIFIRRNCDSNFKSYHQTDINTLRGVIPKAIYKPFHGFMNDSFLLFNKVNPKISTIIDYDKILVDVDGEIGKVCTVLGMRPIKGLKKLIKNPKN